MHTSAPQPSLSRVISLIWFPFFFAAAFTLMGLFAFANPTPHNLDVAVVGTAEQTAGVQDALDAIYPGGFNTRTVATPQAAFAAVSGNEVVAAFAAGTTTSPLLIASAGGTSEAKFVQTAFAAVVSDLGAGPISVTDAVPTMAGDASGVGLFFFAFPQLMVGLVTSIVLLQFGMWSLRKKVLLIAATGLFASVFGFVVGVAMNVIPANAWLILFGFILTQTIGWLTTAAAIFGKRYFLPIALTFVLVLGVPSGGGTVSGSMLPGFIRTLHSFLPFAQYLEASRAVAYFDGAGLAAPLVLLLLWAALGGGLLTLAAVLTARARRAAAASRDAELVDVAAEAPGTGEFFGTVRTTSGRVLQGASVLLVNEGGQDRRTDITDENGAFRISEVPSGLHYAVVTAPHCEPEIATIAVHSSAAHSTAAPSSAAPSSAAPSSAAPSSAAPSSAAPSSAAEHAGRPGHAHGIGGHGFSVHGGRVEHSRDFALLDWDDASGNLTAEEIDSRNALTAH